MSAIDRARITLLAFGLAFALPIVPSWADDAPPTAQALFDAAVQSMEAGRYEEACPKLEESDRLEASGGTALNLGYCHEHRGRYARAYDAYLLAVAHYEASGKPDRKRVAREHADAIRDRVTLVRLAGARLEDVRDVTIDGTTRTFRDGSIAVDRGNHVIRFTAGAGADVATIPFVANAAEVQLVIPEPVAPGPPSGPVAVALPPPPPLRTDRVETPTAGRRTAAWVVGGAGLALLGGAIVTGVIALNREAASDAECPNDRCSVAGVDAHAAAQSFAIAADVLVISAVVALGVSTFLFLTSKPSKSVAFVVRF